uniref:Probable non-specific lipid-transfer protein 1 n=1 Tax=Parietaria judaica TaxID=33127 RepID=NLT13_PARJU|nr:RecName: Full=Probable non-specific lipid-transfer protein 1; Short=LTP; AltName: Full=Allergen Par j I; AltName: Full=Major pollen allergen Par j 1.0201; AltName: Full=Protein P1; AltName: Allergen=Par j 1.0201; Flags: Precursor [Parietaria judaica]CAA59370.1 major allergen [Parietaria judaica]
MRTVSARSSVALVVIVAAVLVWTSSASVAPAPAPGSEETCGTVVGALMPCLPFVQGKEKEPSKGCCSGAKRLDGETKTGPQRVHACECIQTAMKTYSDIDGKLVSEVPKHCGIVDSKLPPIDVNMDCKTLGVLHYKGN